MDHNSTNEATLQRLGDTDLEIAPHESDVRDWTVSTRSGTKLGTVDDLIVDTAANKVKYLEVELDDNREPVFLMVSDVDLDETRKQVIVRSATVSDLRAASPRDLERRIAASNASTSRSSSAAEGTNRLTRAEEELRIGKREVQTGEVRVGKHVETERVHQAVPVSREQVHVERRPVAGDRAGEIRASEDEIRVPIVEEEVVVDKRPVVKEELVISKERTTGEEIIDTDVRKERFDIDQTGGRRDASTRSGMRGKGGE